MWLRRVPLLELWITAKTTSALARLRLMRAEPVNMDACSKVPASCSDFASFAPTGIRALLFGHPDFRAPVLL